MNAPSTPRTLDDLPHPRGLPFFGNALAMQPRHFHLQIEQWAQTQGRLFTLKLGPTRWLAVNDAALSQQVLRDRPDGFRRVSNLEPIAQELGLNGLFSAEGDRWREQRRIWMATLNATQLRRFHDQLAEITGRLLARWQRAADRGEAVDVAHDLMRYTVDVTMRFALGYESDTLERDDDVIQRHLDKIFPAVNERLTALFPYWRYIKLPRDRALDRALAALQVEVNTLVAKARERLRDQPGLREAPTCFLEALLAAQEKGGTGISDETVSANVLTALLAGEDTTANSLAWTIHHCCERPDVYAAMQAEAQAFLGDAAIPRADRFPHLLPHTDAAINETLRLKPVAPFFFLEALRDTVLDGLQIPAGTRLMLLLRTAVGSAPSSVPTPRFDPKPDDPDKAEAGPGRAPTMPFGYGPRMCPGRNLALAEMRSVALMLARHFDLEAVPQAQPVSEVISFTLVPHNLRVRLHRRDKVT
ncbi:MAG: cytochrome P450 [Nevskiaceae bacterium]|nr:MAG: cytochrome P450 [Nevskiaceae bacterium]